MNTSHHDANPHDIEPSLRAGLQAHYGPPPQPSKIWRGIEQRLDLMPTSTKKGAIFMHVNLDSLSTNADGHPLGRRFHGERPSRVAAVTSILAALLVISLFTWVFVYRSVMGVGGSTPQQSTNCLAPKIPPAQAWQVTHQGITVAVEGAIATPTHTSVKISVTALNGKSYQSLAPSLTDAHGVSYTSLFGESCSNVAGVLYETDAFVPLPVDDDGQQQEVTLSIPAMAATTPPDTIKGSWQVTFPLLSQTTGTQALHLPGITQQGVTIAPTHIDWLNETTTLDQVNGGVRIQLHLSGLPTVTNAAIRETIEINSAYSYAGTSGGSSGSDPLTKVFVSGMKDGHSLSGVFPIDNRSHVVWGGEWQRIVSAKGEADIDLAFFNVQLPPGGMLTLHLDDSIHITYAQIDSTNQAITNTIHTYTFTGTGWIFQIP